MQKQSIYSDTKSIYFDNYNNNDDYKKYKQVKYLTQVKPR